MPRIFKAFGRTVYEGDVICAAYKGFDLRAVVERDNTGDAPDQRDEGFWPSQDPGAAGYVRPENYVREERKARRVMQAWRNNDWWYCAIVVTVSRWGVELAGVSLWGIEANYPISRGSNRNHYLRTVADELALEAIHEARVKLAKLCDCREDRPHA